MSLFSDKTMNQTNTSYPYCQNNINVPEKVSIVCLYMFIFIAAIVGNSIVIYLVKSKARLRISFNYFILSMASADLCHAFFVIPMEISFVYAGSQWFRGPFGNFLCKFVPFVVVSSIVASIATLTATTIERFLAAKMILKKPVTSNYAKVIVICIWICSFLVSINELIKFHVVFEEKTRIPHCVPTNVDDWTTTFTYETFARFFLIYVFPLAIMTVLYANIIWMLRVHGGSSLQTEQYKNIQRRKKKLTIKLILITSIFAVCWLPAHVNHFLASYDYNTFSCVPLFWRQFLYLLTHANTAVNPVLYLLLTKNARALFKSTVLAKADHGNENGSRRSGTTRRLQRMFQSFPSDSRIITACVSAQTSDDVVDEEKGHEMKLIPNS